MPLRYREPARVLVVDDSESARMLVSAVLRSSGDTVLEASGADEAERLLENEAFDLVITDLRMPGRDGIELTRSVRAVPATRDTPVIMMTSDTDPGVARRAAEAGVDCFLNKPFEPADLLAATAELLAGPVEPTSHAQPPMRVGSQAMLEAFPYPVMVLDQDHRVVMGNHAFFDLTGTGIGDISILCSKAMHGEAGTPDDCPLDACLREGCAVECDIEEPAVGTLCVSVYPLEALDEHGRRLFLHLAKPVADS